MSGVLISTSVIWFCGRRQKPCCCALHFINHCFMWTRSAPPLPISPLTLAPPGPSAMFTRPPGGSQDQTSSLLITLDYFHLPGVSQAFRQREKERDDFLTNSVACEEQARRVCWISTRSFSFGTVCSCLWQLVAVTGRPQHCIHVYINNSFISFIT